MKVFLEEFKEIQEELYPIDSNKYDVVSSCYESMSSEKEISTLELESHWESEDEYSRSRNSSTTRTRKWWKLYWNNDIQSTSLWKNNSKDLSLKDPRNFMMKIGDFLT